MPYKLLPGECFEGDDDGDRPSVPLGVAMRIKQGRRELIFVDVNDAARTRPARRTDLSKHAGSIALCEERTVWTFLEVATCGAFKLRVGVGIEPLHVARVLFEVLGPSAISVHAGRVQYQRVVWKRPSPMRAHFCQDCAWVYGPGGPWVGLGATQPQTRITQPNQMDPGSKLNQVPPKPQGPPGP